MKKGKIIVWCVMWIPVNGVNVNLTTNMTPIFACSSRSTRQAVFQAR
jgi:hypothetical protein